MKHTYMLPQDVYRERWYDHRDRTVTRGRSTHRTVAACRLCFVRRGGTMDQVTGLVDTQRASKTCQVYALCRPSRARLDTTTSAHVNLDNREGLRVFAQHNRPWRQDRVTFTTLRLGLRLMEPARKFCRRAKATVTAKMSRANALDETRT